MKEIRVIPQDVRTHEFQIRSSRLEEKKKMNIENVVKGALRSIGAMKVTVSDFKEETDKVTVVASYMFKDEIRKTSFNMKADKFGNWFINEFETSFNASEIVPNVMKESKMVIPSNELIIDLSTIKAIQRGNEYSIEHPVIGKIGSLVKDEITEKNIKTLFALFASDSGADIKYINAFAVDFEDQDFTYEEPTFNEINSKDQNIQAKNEMFYYTKSKTEDLNASMRENYDKVIKIEATNFVKRNTSGWKTGPTQIMSVDSFVEIKDSKYVGNIVVRAKVGVQEKTYALPVEKGKLVVKGNIENYVIEDKVFEDLVKKSIDEHLKAQVKKELDHIAILEANDLANLRNAGSNVEAIRTQDVLKTFRVAKVNLEDTEIGDVINLSGIKYKVEAGDNDAYFTLVLVEA